MLTYAQVCSAFPHFVRLKIPPLIRVQGWEGEIKIDKIEKNYLRWLAGVARETRYAAEDTS